MESTQRLSVFSEKSPRATNCSQSTLFRNTNPVRERSHWRRKRNRKRMEKRTTRRKSQKRMNPKRKKASRKRRMIEPTAPHRAWQRKEWDILDVRKGLPSNTSRIRVRGIRLAWPNGTVEAIVGKG